MSSVVVISGTPKAKGSASGAIVQHIATTLGAPVTTYRATKLIRRRDASPATRAAAPTAVPVDGPSPAPGRTVSDYALSANPGLTAPVRERGASGPAAPLRPNLVAPDREPRASDPFSIALNDIVAADALVFVFPLYVDALPAPLVEVLTLLESALAGRPHRPRVYAVCNCGFFEADHTRLALDMIEHFCVRAGLAWQYGVGVGGGGFVSSQNNNPAHGPAANVFAAVEALARATQTRSSPRDNVFVQPRMPRVLYRLAADWDWRRQAKTYHTEKSLMARPYLP